MTGTRGGGDLGSADGVCVSPLVLNVTPPSTYTFKIPEIHFPLVSQCVQAYYSDCVALLSKAMGLLAPDSSVLLARYYYLRGAVHLMQGQLLDALLDFQSLYKTDIRIFPADLVRRTVGSLSGPQRAQAERVPELRRLISEVVDKPREAPKPDDRVKNFELPKKHMQLDDFVKRVQESGIVKDTNTIHRLFEALTVGKRQLWPCCGVSVRGTSPRRGRPRVWGVRPETLKPLQALCPPGAPAPRAPSLPHWDRFPRSQRHDQNAVSSPMAWSLGDLLPLPPREPPTPTRACPSDRVLLCLLNGRVPRWYVGPCGLE